MVSLNLKRTPLYQEHIDLGARMVEFAGWTMPIQYSTLKEEHLSVRNNAGIFDVSHMGEIFIEGEDAEKFVDYLVTNDVTGLVPCQICYTPMCNYEGGVVDDILVYKFYHNKILLVVNASNIEKDYEWILKNSEGFNVEIRNESDSYTQIALQGPKAQEILNEISGVDLHNIKYYHFEKGPVDGIECIVSRTGYTGEDGFELYLKNGSSIYLWRKLLEVGKFMGIKPAGLGCRDTLRFEAALCLYGNELSDNISPLEAGLKWTVKFDKDFIGKSSLLKKNEEGLPYRLRGIELLEKGIARHGSELLDENGENIGWISTGYLSPTLQKSIALGFLKPGYRKIGTEIFVAIRNKKIKAKIIKTPFYKGSVKR